MADTIAGVVIFGGLFVFFAGINWHWFYCGLTRSGKSASPAPFIGGIAGAAAVLGVCGLHHPWPALVPLLLDPGCIPFLVYALICIVFDPVRRGTQEKDPPEEKK